MSVNSSLGALGQLEVDLVTNHGWAGVLDAESREGLEGKDWVGAGAGVQEWSCESQDLGSLKGSVEGRWGAILSEEAGDQGLVAGLDGDDGTGEDYKRSAGGASTPVRATHAAAAR